MDGTQNFRGVLDELRIRDVASPALYTFDGCYPPVDNLANVNLVQVVGAMPIKFSLGAIRG